MMIKVLIRTHIFLLCSRVAKHNIFLISTGDLLIHPNLFNLDKNGSASSEKNTRLLDAATSLVVALEIRKSIFQICRI